MWCKMLYLHSPFKPGVEAQRLLQASEHGLGLFEGRCKACILTERTHSALPAL